MAYLPLVTDMMGTPGTLRIRLLRSRSFAVTGVRLATRGTWGGYERTRNDVDTVLLNAVDHALRGC